jgi:hypothetical protein
VRESMTQRAVPAQLQPVMDAQTLSEGARRSQMLTAGGDEGLPTWGDACPQSDENIPARTIEGAVAEDVDDAQSTVIVDGEHWIERTLSGDDLVEHDEHEDELDDGSETMVGTYDVASTVEVRAVASPKPAKRISETRARTFARAAATGGSGGAFLSPRRRRRSRRTTRPRPTRGATSRRVTARTGTSRIWWSFTCSASRGRRRGRSGRSSFARSAA